MNVLRDLLLRCFRHIVSLSGVLLTTVSALLFAVLFAVEALGFRGGPYLGIIAFVVLPAVFVLGLGLIPVGLWLDRRRRERAAQAGEVLPHFPIIDFNLPRVRNMAVLVFGLTGINVVVLSAGTYKGVETMHSTEFCGTSCHSIMTPEHTGHQRGSHASVACADCHVGEGAGHFVHSKVRGAAQLLAVVSGNFPRPVHAPVDVDTATCRGCHHAERWIGDRLKIRKLFTDEETTVEKSTVYRMKVGGHRDGVWSGIHKHLSLQVRYLADPKRQHISTVQVTDASGATKEFQGPEAAPADAVWRTMDCLDCHNRPAHRFEKPELEVDRALERGVIDRALPFIRREGLKVLKASYASSADAHTQISAAFNATYPQELEKSDRAAKVLADLWAGNNFPDMKVAWGTYADFSNHDGCYRCHDNSHKTKTGEAISKKCSSCHEVLATEEKESEILEVLYPE